jgi:type VI secretion system protein ImpF
MRRAIMAFEPRLLPDTVRVKASYSGGDATRNTLQFEIEGDLWAEPLPLRLCVETEFDLETGEVVVHERSTS